MQVKIICRMLADGSHMAVHGWNMDAHDWNMDVDLNNLAIVTICKGVYMVAGSKEKYTEKQKRKVLEVPTKKVLAEPSCRTSVSIYILNLTFHEFHLLPFHSIFLRST